MNSFQRLKVEELAGRRDLHPAAFKWVENYFQLATNKSTTPHAFGVYSNQTQAIQLATPLETR